MLKHFFYNHLFLKKKFINQLMSYFHKAHKILFIDVNLVSFLLRKTYLEKRFYNNFQFCVILLTKLWFIIVYISHTDSDFFLK